MSVWNPQTYLQFADERARPFIDLVAQVGAVEPARVVDLGCGPGQLTASLAQRWPSAFVTGVDSSPEMIERATEHSSERVAFQIGDLQAWQPDQPVDVIISNATLQWVPDHRLLLPKLVGALAPDGWLAFQVPGNFDAPSHALLYELAERADYAPHLAEVQIRRPAAADPETYLADLARMGCTVNAWETTYLHVLRGPDAVFRWISSTGARPILQALPDELRLRFETAYRALLDQAYPSQAYGTVLPFRRIFVVAHRAG
jgi:trans-aconitate 2-methyltransferase